MLRSEIFQGRYIDGFYATIALETLNLAYNDIHSLDRYLFQHTPNLTRLYLNNNPIEIIDHVTSLALSSAINLEVSTAIYFFYIVTKVFYIKKYSVKEIRYVIQDIYFIICQMIMDSTRCFLYSSNN